MIQRVFKLSVLLAGLFETQVAGAGTLLDLKQTISYGVEHSPRLQSSLASRDNARLDLANIEARYLPKLDADASVNYQYVTSPEFPNSGPFENRTAGLSITETLWDGGVRSYAKDAAKVKVQSAELDYAQARDQLILDIARAFYDYSEAMLAIQSALEHQKMLERQSRDIDAAFHQGLRLKRDSVRMQTDLQRQELVLIGARDQATRAREKLLNLIGASQQLTGNGEAAFDFKLFVPHETSSLAAVLVGSAGRLDIHQTALARRHKLDEEVAQYSLEGERRRKMWPSIDFNLGSNYRLNQNGGRDVPTVFSRNGVNWTASIGLRYTIWDWGIREREIAAILNDQKRATADRSLALADMQQQMTDTRRTLFQSEKNLKLNAALLKLEEESNKEVVTDYKQGKVSYLDLIDAAQRLSDAKLAHAKSYFDWQRSAWAFKFYAGGLFDVVQSL